MPETLTRKQLVFCREYLVDLNATRAAVRAGYSEKTAQEQGSRLLSNAMVGAEVARLMEERKARTEVTQDYVVSRLRENVERAMAAEPVRDKDGNPTGEYRYDGAVANRALELLGKHLGMFRDRVQVGGDPDSPVRHDHASRVSVTAEDVALARAILGGSSGLGG